MPVSVLEPSVAGITSFSPNTNDRLENENKACETKSSEIKYKTKNGNKIVQWDVEEC